MSNDNMFLSAANSNLVKPKSNPIDYEAFRKFQKDLDKRYSKVERERIIRERQSNLEQWDNSLPDRWKDASLSKMNNPAATKALDIIDNKGEGSFFINGSAGSGKTFLSYAIIRKYIGKGWTTFSQIKVISEESMLGYGYTGYIGRGEFEKMFNPIYNTYFFDNVCEREDYDPKREIPLWERIIDHVYTNSLHAVFTSNQSVDAFGSILSESGQSKLETLIEHRTIQINGTRKFTNAQNRNTNRASNKKSVFDNFDG